MPKWNRPNVKKVGENYEAVLNAGESLEGVLPKPAAIPPAPEKVAEPVVIRKAGVL